MRLMEIICIYEKLEIPENLDLTTFDTFRNSLYQLSKEQLRQLQDIWDELKNNSVSGWIELYHGTPRKHAEEIKRSGFKLTKGERSGFLGATKIVDNQGIFLSDSRRVAHFYGSNRADGSSEVLTVYVDPSSKILDIDQKIPPAINRLGVDILKQWDGKTRRKIPILEWWWLLDRPEFSQFIKKQGYDGVRFREDLHIRRMAGSGNTYIIFDPDKIKIKDGPGTMNTLHSFYSWLKSTSEKFIT